MLPEVHWYSNVFANDQSTECCPLKMPGTETGETLGTTTFRTRPKSPKNPQQPIGHIAAFQAPGCSATKEMLSYLAWSQRREWGTCSPVAVGVEPSVVSDKASHSQ